jgi:general secretion pathway protein L
MELLIIEAGRHSVGFVRFEKKGGALFFQGAEHRRQEDQGSFPLLLRDVAEAGSEESKIFLSLDAENIFFRELQLPIADRRKQREVLPLELKGETAIEVEKLVFDSLPLAEGRIMAIWATRDDIEEKIVAMREAGLEPQIVGSSLFHWQHLLPDTAVDGAVALSDGSSLAVYSQGKPVLFRSLDNGNFQEEITRTLVLLEAGKGIRVENVLLHGPAASSRTEGRSSNISFTPLPVTGSLAAAFASGSLAVEFAGAWALAVASLGNEPVNFRHGKLVYTAARERFKKKLRLTAILSVIFLLLLMGETGLRYYFVKRDLNSVNKSINQIYREVFPNRVKAVDELSELKSEIRSLGGTSASQDILQTLTLIAKAKNDEVAGVYEAEFDGDQVRLKGDAKSFQAVNDFKSRLAPYFTSAEMAEVKSKADGTAAFSFQGTLKEGTK